MSESLRLALDTNVVVSSIAFPASTPKRALLRAQASIMLASQATLVELIEVIERSVWDRYIDRQLRRWPQVEEQMKSIKMLDEYKDMRDRGFLF